MMSIYCRHVAWGQASVNPTLSQLPASPWLRLKRLRTTPTKRRGQLLMLTGAEVDVGVLKGGILPRRCKRMELVGGWFEQTFGLAPARLLGRRLHHNQCITAGQNEAQRASLIVVTGMDLHVKPPPGRPKPPDESSLVPAADMAQIVVHIDHVLPIAIAYCGATPTETLPSRSFCADHNPQAHRATAGRS